MRALNNSETQGFRAKADVESEDYAQRVAAPSMAAIDRMPQDYRELVNEFGYVDVYRAWKTGISPDRIRASAQDGIFKLGN